MKIEFTQNELEIIKPLVLERQSSSANDTKYQKIIDDTLYKLQSGEKNYTNMQKALMAGCIRQAIIYPFGELSKKNDYEKLILKDTEYKNFIKLDCGYKILSKLDKNSDKHYRYFSDILEILYQVGKYSTIKYSIGDKGEIYKIGLLINDKKLYHFGLNTDVPIDYFTKEKNSRNYHKTATIKEVLDIFSKYSEKKQLTGSQKSIYKILQLCEEINHTK